jgi:hypothetical protein
MKGERARGKGTLTGQESFEEQACRVFCLAEPQELLKSLKKDS